jgi:hypothetical protein
MKPENRSIVPEFPNGVALLLIASVFGACVSEPAEASVL